MFNISSKGLFLLFTSTLNRTNLLMSKRVIRALYDDNSIQIGLSGIAVEKYLNEWITDIADITPQCRHIHQLITSHKPEKANALLPVEKYYPIPDQIARNIDATSGAL
jgi:hypothetical protein